jgi:hypothetical protein
MLVFVFLSSSVRYTAPAGLGLLTELSDQYINAIALEALKWKYYICYCVFLAFEVGVIYFFLVETRYTPLEEISKFFDGEDRTLDVAAVANEQTKHDDDGVMREKGLTVQQVEIVQKV